MSVVILAEFHYRSKPEIRLYNTISLLRVNMYVAISSCYLESLDQVLGSLGEPLDEITLEFQ